MHGGNYKTIIRQRDPLTCKRDVAPPRQEQVVLFVVILRPDISVNILCLFVDVLHLNGVVLKARLQDF